MGDLLIYCGVPLQEFLDADDVDVVGSATASRLATLLFLRRCLIFSGVRIPSATYAALSL